MKHRRNLRGQRVRLDLGGPPIRAPQRIRLENRRLFRALRRWSLAIRGHAALLVGVLRRERQGQHEHNRGCQDSLQHWGNLPEVVSATAILPRIRTPGTPPPPRTDLRSTRQPEPPTRHRIIPKEMDET